MQKVQNFLVLMAVGIMISGFLPNAHAEVLKLKLADQFPLTHIASKLGPQAFIKNVEKASNGAIKIEHYPAQQLAKAVGLLDAVKNRVADIAVVGVVYISNKMPLTTVAELPGMGTSYLASYRALNKLAFSDLVKLEYQRQRVRPVWVMTTPPYQLMMVNNEAITDIQHLEGKKLRVAGATAELVANSLGAVPVKVPASDLYLALERGTIEGAIWNTPSMFAYKIQEVINSVTTNANLGSVVFITFINEAVWNKLSPENQKIIAEAGQMVGENTAHEFDKAVSSSNGKLKELNKNVYPLPPDVLEQFGSRLKSVKKIWVEQMENRNLPGQDVLTRYEEYLSE